ncbi:Lrp/AsnC family transcriptional regulator [Cupriavidus sp. L7L]|uniref:Lrp/AsnC family transcriptional regulator n=1 Tax=Cupriavidus sp. L7L TaxID=2546443 RepID=UPI0010542C14|nr:Lrp/AsnC family transcriptional regulator [Cupriavidus sp. L7L]TDF62667.1 Lrp/AsnC family transcriptional regulator [Cupriavidus sp. L7L]
MQTDLDTIDIAILRALEMDGRITNLDLAKQVGLSQSACLRRVKQLEQNGVIKAYKVQLDSVNLGLEVQAIVQVTMRPDGEGWHEAFKRTVAEWPEVAYAYVITGSSNYILLVRARSLKEYADFVIGRLYKTPGVLEVTSNIVLEEFKGDGSPLEVALRHVKGKG